MDTPMDISEIVTLAQRHADKMVQEDRPFATSALHAVQDAQKLLSNGQDKDAKRRAITSLAYSIGIGHADYKRATGRTN